MKWPGIHDDSSSIGSGLDEVWNVSYRRSDSIIRRPGLADRIDAKGIAMSEINDPNEGLYWIFADATNTDLVSVKASDLSSYTLNGSIQNRYGQFTQTQGAVYYVNGQDPMQVMYDGESFSVDAGIDPPNNFTPTTSAGNATDGDHLVRIRYRNTATGYVSNPTATQTVTTSSQKIVISSAAVSIDSKVDEIILEATTAGGTVYYVADTKPNEAGGASLELDEADTALILREVIGSGVGNAKPPVFDSIHAHRGRIFGIGLRGFDIGCTFTNGSKTVTGSSFEDAFASLSLQVSGERSYAIATIDSATQLTLTEDYAGTNGLKTASFFRAAEDTLFWSGALLPEGWDEVNQARRVFQGRADRPTCIFSYYNDLMICGRRSMFRLSYDNNPLTGRIEIIPGDLGVYNNRCVVEAEGRIYGFGAGGIWAMSGLVPKLISEPIYRKLEDQVDTDQFLKFFAIYDPDERVVQFHYVADGDSQPYEAACLDIQTGNWSFRSWRQPLVGGFTTVDTNNIARALVSDNTGYSWFLRDNRFDGVPSSLSSGVVTADSGASTTVIPVTETLPTSPSLEGATLYWPSVDETRTIASNLVGSITVSSAFTNAPSAGTELWMGSIRLSLKTKWLGDAGRDKRKRISTAGIRFVPSADGSDIELYTYLDFSANAEQVSSNAMDTWPSGVTVNDGDSYVTVNTDTDVNSDGYVELPETSEMQSHVSWEIRQYDPGGDIEIVDFLPIIGDEVRNLQ